MAVPYFGIETLHEIANHLMNSGLDSIDTLLIGMDTAYKATLPSASTPIGRMLATLDALNKTERLQSGEVPMRTFLFNAVLLSRPRPQSQALSTILTTLDTKLAQAASDLAQNKSPAPTDQSGSGTAPLSVSSPTVSIEQINLPRLVQNIQNAFNMDELETICFNLNIDFDSIEGSTKAAKARELVSHLNRRGSLLELINELIRQRPTVNWVS